jgi:hypothetical protein
LPKETIFLNPSLRDVKDFHVLRKTKWTEPENK